MRLNEPVAGTVSPLAFEIGGQTMVAVGLYFYGDAATDFVALERPKWQTWMTTTFPPAGVL